MKALALLRLSSKSLLVATLIILWAMAPGGNQAIAGSIIYADDFSGATLNPAWQVLPGQGSFTVGGGALTYHNEGPLSSPTGWSTTSLALALPFTGVHWQLDIQASYSLAWLLSGSYTGPAVPTFAGSSGAQGPEVMLSFDPVTAANRSALAGSNVAVYQRAVDAWYGGNNLSAWYGGSSASGLINPADSGITNNIADGTYWYRLSREDGALTMSYSYDGTHYTTALSSVLANPASSSNELVLSGVTYLTAGSFVEYRNLTILDTVPEPSTWSFIALSVLVLAGLRAAAGRASRAGLQ